jgi:hypothetical protein
MIGSATKRARFLARRAMMGWIPRASLAPSVPGITGKEPT